MDEVKQCCRTCKYFYTEYGFALCKLYEEPQENIDEDKCSQYEADDNCYDPIDFVE